MKVLLAKNELLDEWLAQLEESTKFHVAMALVTKTGLDLVIDEIEFSLKRGATGQMLIGTDLPSEPIALSTLAALQRRFPGQFEVRRFQPEKIRLFHPKVSIFVTKKNRARAILGSSNLTGGGFVQNVEANVLIDSQTEVGKLARSFDVLFLGRSSHAVSAAWLREYKKRWVERKVAMKALRRSREKVGQIKVKQPTTKPPPKRIKDATFVFTGRLGNGWTRETVIKKVKRLGGIALDTPPAVKQADCLVEGNIDPYLESTRKLETAREHDVAIISAEDFLRIYGREQRFRGRRRE